MSYRSTHIQLVDMYFSAQVTLPEFQQWLDEVEAFIQQQQNFTLIMQTELNTTFPEEYRQIQAAWYKKNKAGFFQYCLGLVRLAQDEEDQKRLNTPALHAAWRVPYYVTLDHQDALHWALRRWV